MRQLAHWSIVTYLYRNLQIVTFSKKCLKYACKQCSCLTQTNKLVLITRLENETSIYMYEYFENIPPKNKFHKMQMELNIK